MTKWQRLVQQEIHDAGLIISEIRGSGHHTFYRLAHASGLTVRLTISQSPRSIEQAVRRVRRDLRQRLTEARA